MDIYAFANQLQNPQLVDTKELVKWIDASTPDKHEQFFGDSSSRSEMALKQITQIIVNQYLNNGNYALRDKTRLCVILSNLALRKSVRPIILSSLGDLTNIFEESIRKEGTIEFDGELGRMSEHVLVLMMRVSSYELSAGEILELVEQNRPFSISLLLAALQKYPPYEKELLCNVISALYGFTQPQTFFVPGEAIIEKNCEKFSEEIDVIMQRMLQHNFLHIINTTLLSSLMSEGNASPSVSRAMNDTINCVFNIFQFCSKGALEWRQSVLCATEFVDEAVMLFIQVQTLALSDSLEDHSSTREIINSLISQIRFCSFASYDMGIHARCLRLSATFIHDLLNLSWVNYPQTAESQELKKRLYISLFHFLANINAFIDGGDMIDPEACMLSELSGKSLQALTQSFLEHELTPMGPQEVSRWLSMFLTPPRNVLIAKEAETFSIIEAMLQKMTLMQVESSKEVKKSPGLAPPERLGVAQTVLQIEKNQKSKKKSKKKDNLVPAAIEGRKPIENAQKAPPGADPRVVCSLTGNFMKIPVISPYGDRYEEEAIKRWLYDNGSVCPITGKELTLEMLKPDKEAMQYIMQEMIKQTIQNSDSNLSNDLYDF